MFGQSRNASSKSPLAFRFLRVVLTWALVPALAVAGTPLAACRCACCPAASTNTAGTASAQAVVRCPHCRPQPASASTGPHRDRCFSTTTKCDNSGPRRCCCSRTAVFDRPKLTHLSGRGWQHDLVCILPTVASATDCVCPSAQTSFAIPRISDVTDRPTLLCRLLI